ncbi:hypothetical protein OBBRIDRAFT_576072 [Obba rivulosa]|uniref:DUF6593 domain-containing protein n=1 Tax=Obba rivulosa TaxID=1052685 RepID=A0A8E2DT13_9APHY|nr:hypothetical protein OBBRIDRAFT_576072 [Obba rivulosa]
MASSTPLILTLTPDNPCNTAITDVDGKVLYSVKTEHGEDSVTYIRNGDDEVLASSKWREILPDKVTVGGKPPISVNDWLHKSIIPFVDEITFKDDAGRKYKWKGWSAGSSLELFTVDDDYKQPIARFLKPHKDHSTDPPTVSPAQLVLDTRAVEIRNTVIISFLLLEKTRRTRETSTQNKADVLGTPALNVLSAQQVVYHNSGV